MRSWRFSVHPAGLIFLLSAVFFYPADKLLAAAAAILLHEGAHLLTMRLCGIKCCTVEWTPLGFVAQAACYSLLEPSRRLCIAAAGLAASATAYLLCLPFASRHQFFFLLATANLSVLLINSLPTPPLDGSRILLAMAAKTGCYRAMERMLLRLSYGMAAAFAALGLYSVLKGIPNFALLLLGPYLAYAAKQSMHASSIDSIRRLECSVQKPGTIWPASVWASVGEPDRTMLLNALQRCPEGRMMVLHQLDAESGQVCGIHSEKQITSALFSGHELSSKSHRHKKTDVVQ